MSNERSNPDIFGVPGPVVFGPNPKGGDNLTWSSLREMENSQERIVALEARLRSYLVDGLSNAAENAHPFSSAALVMIGIEAFGEILFRDGSKGEDASKQRFCDACSKIDQKFGRQLPKTGAQAFARRWNVSKPKSMGEIVYTFFRNSIVHSFYGRGLYLTCEDTKDVQLTDEGIAMLNPDWLLKKYRCSSGKLLDKLVKEKNGGALRRNALKYLEKLLKQSDAEVDEASDAGCPT
ncbi:MAG: hypothetical protein H7A51_04040 [Akkermansiaceae bacterium]|nr:hypothetical protein [Akkermansiaceae bacterium]